jgi:hypothetical protein
MSYINETLASGECPFSISDGVKYNEEYYEKEGKLEKEKAYCL